jgi:transketolase
MMAPQLFFEQDEAWRHEVLPPGGRRVSLEAGVTDPWWRMICGRGLAIGIDRFGESAPIEDLARHFGLTPDRVAGRIEAWARTPGDATGPG